MDAPSRPDLRGFDQQGSFAVGCAPGLWSAIWWNHPRRRGHVALLVMVLLSSPPSLAQFDGQPWGAAEAADGGLFWDRSFGTQEAPGKDDPSFDYPLPTQDAGRGRGGSTWPPPGYNSYPGPTTSGQGGFQVGVEPPSYVRDRGSATGRPDDRDLWSGQRQQGYRFRGDEAPGDSAWEESPDAPGYRFRPLTRAEQERASNTDGWRPLERDKGRPVERPTAPPDAFGGRSGSWFSKYYGDRP